MAITRVAAERRLTQVFQDLEKAYTEGRLEDPGLQAAYNTLGVLLSVMKVGEPLLGAWSIVVNGYAKTAMQIGEEAVGRGNPGTDWRQSRRRPGAFVFFVTSLQEL